MSIIGAVIEGLLWLTVVRILLFAGTAVYGYLKNSAPTGGRCAERLTTVEAPVSGNGRLVPRHSARTPAAAGERRGVRHCGPVIEPGAMNRATSCPLNDLGRPGDYTIHDAQLGAALHGLVARQESGLWVGARATWLTDEEPMSLTPPEKKVLATLEDELWIDDPHSPGPWPLVSGRRAAELTIAGWFRDEFAGEWRAFPPLFASSFTYCPWSWCCP